MSGRALVPRFLWFRHQLYVEIKLASDNCVNGNTS